MQDAGDDIVEQLAAGIRRYIEIVDENLDAVVRTYRESRTLDAAGRAQIKDLEIATAAPLRSVIQAGIDDGVFADADVDVVVFDIMPLAHGWALKHLMFPPISEVDVRAVLPTVRVPTLVVQHSNNALMPSERGR